MNRTELHSATGETRQSGIRIGLLSQMSARRAQRAARTQLRRELATYTSQADLDDLHATLDRYDDEETAPVRDALRRSRARQSAGNFTPTRAA